MKRLALVASLALNAILLVTPLRQALLEPALAQDTPQAETNYLYTMSYGIGTGQSFEEAEATMKALVQSIRRTGEYKSVRLFMHQTGPEIAYYVHMEPNSWQSIETGAGKWVPEAIAQQRVWQWASHSDNLMTEVHVE